MLDFSSSSTFFPRSAALSAASVGVKPFSSEDMELFYRQLAQNLGWNFSNM